MHNVCGRIHPGCKIPLTCRALDSLLGLGKTRCKTQSNYKMDLNQTDSSVIIIDPCSILLDDEKGVRFLHASSEDFLPPKPPH